MFKNLICFELCEINCVFFNFDDKYVTSTTPRLYSVMINSDENQPLY